MVCAKFAHTTFDSNSLYLEQLPRQFELFLRREFRIVLLERLGVAHGDKVRFGVAVAAGDSVEEPFLQFLAEEVGRVAVGGVRGQSPLGERVAKNAARRLERGGDIPHQNNFQKIAWAY